MKYELIIIWDDGTTETHFYNSESKATEIEAGFKMAFGNQIQWSGIRERRV